MPEPDIDPSSERSPDSRRSRLVVIDGANTFYRAFFALPGLRAPDGRPTNAAYGFVTMLIKVLREEHPTHLVVAKDPRGGSFRREIDPRYKSGRDAQPEDLTVQLPLVDALCEAFHVPMLEVPDFEADDVIATLVERAPEDMEICIVSTDKDLMQLVRPGVELLDTMKGRRIDEAAVQERFGVPPSQLLDLRALVGDPSDNIPGVKGIGEKGAASLIAEWGSLDALLEGADRVKAKRAREALLAHEDEARLSRELATLRSDVPLHEDWDVFAVQAPDRERLRALYQELGFTRLLDALARADSEELREPGDPGSPVDVPTPTRVVLLREEAALGEWIESLKDADSIAIAPVVIRENAVESQLLGLCVAAREADPVYVVLAGDDLLAQPGVCLETLVEALGRLWASGRGLAWIGFDTKDIQSFLAEAGLELPLPALDVLIASQLLDSTGARPVSALASEYLGSPVSSWEDIAGRGARAKSAEDLGLETVSGWAASQATALLALQPVLRDRLETNGLAALYDHVEGPLTAVLSRMERAGVRVDEAQLGSLSREFEKDLDRLEREIHQSAGEKFLVSSPKQLQVILFEKLGLPVVKKTKTGYSTDESVLEQLVVHHELPARILAWRKLSKLKTTYIDALPPLVSPQTGRIHPRFHQLGAATGRLSASHPNVQNIPIRGDQGARIREAFVPAEGRVLVSADYSQVELRIMAHYSGDASLIESFRLGEDIHRRTAAEVAGIALEAVTEEQRARAKAVNFGILYGSSAFGLARQLGIAAGEAQDTIDAYFAQYEGVRRFLDETIEKAREQGFVQTWLGRRRALPDLASRNRGLRQAAERMATNTVIQGTAADLIKKAMVEVDHVLRELRSDARMVLQVHDELVFEVPVDEQAALSSMVRDRMEGVAELAVPLTVEIGVGRSWRDAH